MGQLFDKGMAAEPAGKEPTPSLGGVPRLRVPQRDQVEMQLASLDELLELDHRARLVWEAATTWPLDGWLQSIKAIEGGVGRDATDPRLLVALWVYATLEGVGSARELARLCQAHAAYRWLCGGVTVNYHLLADFRSRGGEAWDRLLTAIVAALLAEGLVTLNRVAQDGMRVRASAGRSSFRRKGTLARCLQEAHQQVETLKRLADEDPTELSRRQRSARQRSADERRQRVEAALRHCQELESQRELRSQKSCQPARESRASTTDPEARSMKFAHGGYAPGYNVQFSTAVGSGVIVGVDAASAGNDGAQLPAMLDQLVARYGASPAEALVDGGFATKEAIADAADGHRCTVYAPLKDEAKQRARGTDPHAAKKGDSTAVAAWRARMADERAQTIYRQRASTAEWVNALAHNRGLVQFAVRGLVKCRITATIYAIAHNLLQATNLRTAATRA